MNREIPGFYYGMCKLSPKTRCHGGLHIDHTIDPEKKKYFKIQASHKAAPGAQYSKDAVKRKRVEHEVAHLIPIIQDEP